MAYASRVNFFNPIFLLKKIAANSVGLIFYKIYVIIYIENESFLNLIFVGGSTMINSKDILARLQNGETAEAIANELVGALNDANDIYMREQEAKRKAEAKAEERNARKIAAMQDILDALHDFCIEFYCESNEDINAVEEAFADLTAEKIINIVEEAGAAVLKFEEQLKDIEKMFGSMPSLPIGNMVKPTVEIKVDKDATSTDADAVIGSFLKSIGLK